MKNITRLTFPYFKLFVGCLALIVVTACGPADTPTPVATPQSPTTDDSPVTSDEQPATQDDAYPGATTADSAYPGAAAVDTASGYPTDSGEQQELLSEPPNPDVDIPAPEGSNGAIGGILVQEVTDSGFLPFDPFELILAELVLNNEGEPTLISFDEKSLRAETFPTGVFVFTNVPPGTYGLVVNTAVNQFPLKTDEGEDLLITLEPGQAIDLGQVFVRLP